ncbi:MAG: hypothetical protein H7A23_07975 [Leptospiraceae bacterium]|nr:hypothetical protein [Leptospiraceae bacterium]MCP5494481.1 hypothetical protein [Leptospiraceae bacterium]
MIENEALKEKINQMELAMESVLTEEQAVEVINNQFKDAYLLKLKVNVENKAGAMLLLVSVLKSEILMMYSVFGNSTVIRKIGTFEDPKQFSDDILAALNAGGIDQNFSNTIGRILYTRLDSETIKNLRPTIEKKDFNDFSNIIIEAINTTYKINSTRVEADMERINSVRFRLNSALVEKTPPIVKPEIKTEEVEEAKSEKVTFQELEKSEVDKEIDEIISQFPAVVTSKTILSPVSGVEFEKLQFSQKILFQLPFQTPEEKTIARKLGAEVKDGVVRPIVGEFLKLVPGHKNEYHIFAKGPKGVLLRAFEERPVRLAVPKGTKIEKSTEEESSTGKFYFLGIVVIVLIVASILYVIINS